MSLVNVKNLHDSRVQSDRYISPKIWLILPLLPSLLFSLAVILQLPLFIDIANIENLNPIQQEAAIATGFSQIF